MSDAPSKKKTGKKPKRKSSSSPKSAKSGKSKSSSSPSSPIQDVRVPEISGIACFRHHKEVKFFCEIHEEVLCDDCLAAPPYTTSQSRILKIEEAYRKRFTSAYQVLNSQIFPKRDQITAQLSKINLKIEEVRDAKALIEKDMKGEFSAMNERLSSNFGTKVALLEYDISELQADLDRIDYIIRLIQSANSDIHAFLAKYAEIRDTTDLILAKPFRTEINVDPETLPKELIDVRENVLQYPALKSLLKTKDEIIFKLVQENGEYGKIDDSTQRELTEWAKLTEKFNIELNKYRMNCEYCNCALDPVSVNSNCSRNSGSRHYFIRS